MLAPFGAKAVFPWRTSRSGRRSNAPSGRPRAPGSSSAASSTSRRFSVTRSTGWLAALREKQGTAKPNRASRLLVIADDGTERFYRSCEAVLHRHGDRVLGLRVAVSSSTLGQSLYGKDTSVQALLVSDRVAVTQVLLSLVPSSL
jgi:hypothetical protein